MECATEWLLSSMESMLPNNKTKLVCTIGPASNSQPILERLMGAGMNIARLNFSHGDFSSHKQVIDNIRAASQVMGHRVAIMADLSGPKMRIGKLEKEPIQLEEGDSFVLTTAKNIGDQRRVSVTFARLPEVVKLGDALFLNDGLIELEVVDVNGLDVNCRVVVGGELRSRKGLNLPGIDLGMCAFTEYDHACLVFALEHGVDAVSQSFVSDASDVQAVRQAAKELGHSPFIIAKIERKDALDNIDSILAAADGIMVARGDLGVEIPIESIAVVQKGLVNKANKLGKPVITATHMLESMVEHRRPTRAEVTDVANAILDGSDCVMLSGESAMGKYPVESVSMLSKIAAVTEPHRTDDQLKKTMRKFRRNDEVSTVDLIALGVQRTLESVCPVALIVPTRSGATARNIARFRLPVWITAFSPTESTCQELQFSYGVTPIFTTEDYTDWNEFAREWLRSHGIDNGLALLTQGPSGQSPAANHRIEILELGGEAT